MNLLLITLDTVRADHLGCYGYVLPTSPVIDELASVSLVFDNAIAQSAVTPVSHASILTGLNPYRHHLRSLHGGRQYALPDDRLTLAELLRANGYATGGFVSAFPASAHFGLHQGFETWDESFSHPGEEQLISDKGIVHTQRAQRRADATTESSLAWLRSESGDPFFLWIHYFDAHDANVLPPSEYVARFPPASHSRDDRLRAIYDAEIAFIDAQIGRVLQTLDEMGVRDRTVISIVGDHGQGLGDHNWWGHSILFQEQVRVPFLLSFPGEGRTGRRKELVRTIDLLPTILDIMGIDCPQDSCKVDGESLREVIDGSGGEPRIAYSETINDLAAYYGLPIEEASMYAVNDGRWKLIAHYEGQDRKASMLFDLESDPGEALNLVDVQPAVHDRLTTQLESLGAIVDQRRMDPLDPETRERLRSLGYVE